MKQTFLLSIFILFFLTVGHSQDDIETKRIKIQGKIYTAIITATDTLLLADLEDVSVTAPRAFSSDEEYRLYMRFRRYANKVFPYAVRAIKTYRDVKDSTAHLSKRKRRKATKQLQRRLEGELKEPLKKLTKQQGYILTKMIEKELDVPMYDVVKEMRGWFTANYWNSFGRIYGYKLKEGYIPGKDKILDIVLKDYDISYEIKK